MKKTLRVLILVLVSPLLMLMVLCALAEKAVNFAFTGEWRR